MASGEAAPTHNYGPKKSVSYAPGPIGPRPPELDDFVSISEITFKEKLIMKVKQNPFVPIGKLTKLPNSAYSSWILDGNPPKYSN